MWWFWGWRRGILFLLFFFSLFWIVYKGREAEEINLCPLFVISAVFSDHWKPFLCSCSSPFQQVFRSTNGSVLSACAVAQGALFMWVLQGWRCVSVPYSWACLLMSSLPGPLTPPLLCFSSKNRPASCGLICGHTCACFIIAWLSLFAFCCE